MLRDGVVVDGDQLGRAGTATGTYGVQLSSGAASFVSGMEGMECDEGDWAGK